MGQKDEKTSRHNDEMAGLSLASSGRCEKPADGPATCLADGDSTNPGDRAGTYRRKLAGAAEFRHLMAALLRFAREGLGIASAAASDALARQDAASDMLDALWENRQLIDEFARLNPEGLSKEELEAVRLWRHAIAGRFVVTDAEGGLMALVTSGTQERPRLILADLLERKAEDVFHELPCLTELVLLPYQGRIVTDGRIKRVSSIVMPGGHELIRQRLRLAMKSPPITTAKELIELKCESTPSHWPLA